MSKGEGEQSAAAGRRYARFRQVALWVALAMAGAGLGAGIQMTLTRAPASITTSPPPSRSQAPPAEPVDVTGGVTTPGGQGVWTVALPANTEIPHLPPDTTCTDLHTALGKLGGMDVAETFVELISRVRRPVKDLQLESIHARIVRRLPSSKIISIQCFPKDWVVSYPDATFSLDSELNNGRSLVPPSSPIELTDLGGALPNFAPGELNSRIVTASSYGFSTYEWEIVLRFRADGLLFTDVVRDAGRPFVVTGSERPSTAGERYVWCEGPRARLEKLPFGTPCQKTRGPIE